MHFLWNVFDKTFIVRFGLDRNGLLSICRQEKNISLAWTEQNKQEQKGTKLSMAIKKSKFDFNVW